MWNVVSTAEGIASWFMPNDFVLEVGHEFHIQSPFGPSPCKVLEIDEPNRNRPSKQYVANLFAQDRYGYDGQMYTSYDAFLNSLRQLKEFCIENNIKSIAFPEKIGCGRGGADWQIISRMIETTFEDLIFRENNQLKLYYYFLNEEKDENGLYNSGTSLFAE